MRDYGRNDLAQIRIKKDRLLDPSVPHLYIRGDGTRVYFFEKEELKEMLERSPREAEGRMFEISQLGEDRRMVSCQSCHPDRAIRLGSLSVDRRPGGW
jgi:tRNAThr (cytosine32-N3)-methyltransferase